jgi:hypothetical protein
MPCRLQGRSRDWLSCSKADPRSHPPLLIPLPPASPSNTQVPDRLSPPVPPA